MLKCGACGMWREVVVSGKLIISEPETVQLANLEAAADHSSFLWSHTTTRVSILA